MKRNCFLTHKEILSFLADNFDEPGVYIIRRHGRTSLWASSPTEYDKSSVQVFEFKPEVKEPEEETVQDA